jgi:hypothetical protein
MFKENKYTATYWRLISKYQDLELSGYSEAHHIIPRSLGGTDEHTNLVRLPAKAHYVAHLLLTKMTEGEARQKMICAMVAIANLGQRRKHHKVTARRFEIIKREWAAIATDRYRGGGNPYAGRKHSDEVRAKMSKSSRESSLKQRTCRENLAKAQAACIGKPAPNRGKNHKPETIEKLRHANRGEKNGFFGKKHSEESLKKMSESHNAEPKRHCYSCGRDFDARNYGRWHGERCKKN